MKRHVQLTLITGKKKPRPKRKGSLRLIYTRKPLGTYPDSPADEDRLYRLWFAVLERAIQDAIGCTNYKIGTDQEKDLIQEARDYLKLFRLNPEEEEGPIGSAEWICNLLNFNLQAVRDATETAILEGYRRRNTMQNDKHLHELILYTAKQRTNF